MLYINSSVTCLQFAPKWSFSYFQPILVAIFVTKATVKVKSIPDLNTLAFVLINLWEDSCEKQPLFFWPHVGAKIASECTHPICVLRPSDYKFQQLKLNMAVLCFHNISIGIIKHYYWLCDHQKHFIERVSLSMKLKSAIFVEMGVIRFAFLCNHWAVFLI